MPVISAVVEAQVGESEIQDQERQSQQGCT
jgi:hypothetical protein